MTVAPDRAAEVERMLAGLPHARVGTVTANPVLNLRSSQLPKPISLLVEKLADAYRQTLAKM